MAPGLHVVRANYLTSWFSQTHICNDPRPKNGLNNSLWSYYNENENLEEITHMQASECFTLLVCLYVRM